MACSLSTSINLWYWRVGTMKVLICVVWGPYLTELEGVLICECGYSKHIRNKGNVFCFDKSQQGVTSSCSRLKLAVCFIALDKVSSQLTYALKTFSTRKRHVWVHTEHCWRLVWLRSCKAFYTVMD